MLPENLSLAHIAMAMETTPEKVIQLAGDPRIAYAHPKWEPHNGKMRLITKPKKKWKKRYQHLASFLRRKFPPHSAAHGSVSGRSPFTAGVVRCGHRHLICREVKDAFPSVKASRFYLEMLALGFDRETAELLTKLLLPDGYIPQGGTTSNVALDLFLFSGRGTRALRMVLTRHLQPTSIRTPSLTLSRSTWRVWDCAST
jgi:hypothetical protein